MQTDKSLTAKEVSQLMRAMENEEQKAILSRFFKTGKGEYGEGDQFLGIKVPETRKIVKAFRNLPFEEVNTLINSKWHEERLCGFLILVDQYNRKKTSAENKEKILQFYLANARKANNWDLVDLSCYNILGQWLVESDAQEKEKLQLMDRLAKSDNLWEQRISIVSTMTPLKQGDPTYTLRYARLHLTHPHDLMHKATGWLLREMGKQCGMDILRDFLNLYAATMPRTTLRYAIEKMDQEERNRWMNQK